MSIVASLVLTLGAACGNDTTGQEFRTAIATAGAVVAPTEAPSAEALGRAAVTTIPGPVMIAVLRDGEAVAALVPFGENRGHRTWSTVEKQTLTFRGGVLTATRGLGDDLMSAEVSEVVRLLGRDGSGQARRVMRSLDGDDGTVAREFVCALSPAGSEVVTLASGQALQLAVTRETCTGDAFAFENTYWKDKGGTVRRSRQWVSSDVGHAVIEVLRD